MTEGIPSTSALPCRSCNQTFGGAHSPVDAALGAVAPDDADSDADCSSGAGVDWSAMSSRN